MIIKRVEVWSDLKCNGGTHQADIAHDEIFSASFSGDVTNGKGEFSIDFDRTSVAWAAIQSRYVFRVTYTDDTVEEYRIVKPVEQRLATGARHARVTAVSIYNDLGNGVITRTEANGTVTVFYTLLSQTRSKLVDLMLAASPSYFSKGTVTDSTTKVPTFTFDYDTPLKALLELAELEELELAIRRNGDTDYEVDLITQVGSSASVPEFRFRKNVLGVSRELDASELANRIYPGGGSDGAIKLSVGKARWEVTSVSGPDITLDGNPIYADDVLDGYWVEDDTGTYQIQATDFATQTLTLPSGHTVTQNELIWIREDSAGTELVYVEDKDSQSTYGVVSKPTEENDLPFTDNLVTNASLGDWSSSMPDNWTEYSTDSNLPTVTNSADESGLNPELYSKIGGGSAHVVATAAGQGLESDQISITPADPMLFFSGIASLYVVSGIVEFWWEHETEGRFPEEGVKEAAYTSETERWIDLMIEGKQYPESTNWVKLYVTAKDGAAEWYLDAVQFTNTAGNQSFFDGRAANELWRRGLRSLTDYSTPLIKYDINVLDLTAIDSTTWPYDAITLGGYVYVSDDELGIDATVRCLTLQRDLLRGHNTKLQLSNKKDDILDILTRRRRRTQVGPETRASVALIAFFDVRLLPDGTVVLRLIGSGSTRSFRYTVGTASMPTLNAVIASGTASNEVTGVEVQTSTSLAYGQRAYVRAVSFPLLSGAGVAGETSTDMAGPAVFWNPSIDGTSASQIGDGFDADGAIIRRTFTVNGPQVAEIRLFRRKSDSASPEAYPTTTGAYNAPLDDTYDRGTITLADSWTYQDGGYITDDVVWDLAIPIDSQGLEYRDDPEDRVYDYQVVTGVSIGSSSGAPSGSGGGSPYPYIESMTLIRSQNGTDCGTGNRAQYDIDWTSQDWDSTHEAILERKINKDSWEDVTPSGGLSPTDSVSGDEIPWWCSKTTGDNVTVYYRLTIRLNVSPFTVYDTLIKSSSPTLMTECPT